MSSEKYGRTYHYPFSPGTTSDDRFNHTYWEDIQKIDTILHTEKLDGENNCISSLGVFARSHVASTVSPWTAQLRQRWGLLKNDLGDLEFFGENLYAIHSIEYKHIEEYLYIFAVRENGMWLSWEEVEFYAKLFDFPTVPVLGTSKVSELTKNELQTTIENFAKESSVFGSIDPFTGKECTREGVVTRNLGAYPVSEFRHNVFKYVRKGHVKTDKHWTRTWKRAKLIWELKAQNK